ncbi:MAG: hypothetical protein IT392_12470 [Nitrospirae bacterium]|nr:hypothetical protein [Nitrospirota bacterium]
MEHRGTGGYGGERVAVTYNYTAYGLTVSVPFICPALPTAPADAAPDVTVVYGTVPMKLAGSAASNDSWDAGFCWQAAPGRYLLRGGLSAGRFLVEDGNRVTLERNSAAEDERLLFHLLHSVTAALFRQRGFLVLHASSANTPAGTIALCGKSRAGKSTTLAAMIQNGCTMVSDDLTILRRAANGCIEVVPGTTMMHLWDDAAQGVGLDISGLSRHPMRRGKAALEAPGAPCLNAAPLHKIFILEPSTGKNIRLSRLSGTEKLDALLDCVYGPLFAEEHPGLFTIFSSAASQTDIFRVKRPESRWTVHEVVEFILNG